MFVTFDFFVSVAKEVVVAGFCDFGFGNYVSEGIFPDLQFMIFDLIAEEAEFIEIVKRSLVGNKHKRKKVEAIIEIHLDIY